MFVFWVVGSIVRVGAAGVKRQLLFASFGLGKFLNSFLCRIFVLLVLSGRENV